MKRSILMLFVMSAALIFFGCEKETIQTPGSDDLVQEESALKGAKANKPAKFIGTSSPVVYPEGPYEDGVATLLDNGKTEIVGVVAAWFEDASDWRVSGKSVWTANYLWDGTPMASHGIMEGTCEIFVGISHPDDFGYDPDAVPLGKWEITWTGELTINPDGSVDLVAIAYGVGTEGVVKGLRANWVYTFDFVNGRYNTKGYIKHGKKTKKRRRHH